MDLQTVFYAARESDGYVSVFFYEKESVRDFHYEYDEEGFGATDSDGSFTCIGFNDFHQLSEIVEEAYGYRDKQRMLELAEEHLDEEDFEFVKTKLSENKE